MSNENSNNKITIEEFNKEVEFINSNMPYNSILEKVNDILMDVVRWNAKCMAKYYAEGMDKTFTNEILENANYPAIIGESDSLKEFYESQYMETVMFQNNLKTIEDNIGRMLNEGTAMNYPEGTLDADNVILGIELKNIKDLLTVLNVPVTITDNYLQFIVGDCYYIKRVNNMLLLFNNKIDMVNVENYTPFMNLTYDGTNLCFNWNSLVKKLKI